MYVCMVIISLTCTVFWFYLQICCYSLKLSIYDDSTCVLLEFTKFYYRVIIKPCGKILLPVWICSFSFYRRILKLFHSHMLKHSITTPKAWLSLYHLTYTISLFLRHLRDLFSCFIKNYILLFILWFNIEYKPLDKKFTIDHFVCI